MIVLVKDSKCIYPWKTRISAWEPGEVAGFHLVEMALIAFRGLCVVAPSQAAAKPVQGLLAKEVWLRGTTSEKKKTVLRNDSGTSLEHSCRHF